MLDTILGLIRTRGAQLISRYVGIGLLFLAGKVGVVFDTTQLSSVSTGLSMLIIGGFLFILDHYIHAKATA